MSEMNYLHDVLFIGTLFSCFVFVIRNHCSQKQCQNKKVLVVNDCKNTSDISTQTPNENVPHSTFMFNIQPVNSCTINAALQSNDEHVKYILTILVPEKQGEHRLKAIQQNSRWGICECAFHQVIIVDHHNTRQNTHTVRVIEGDGSTTHSIFDFIMKYSTDWPIHHSGNCDGCRFMIVNGKFLLLGIALYNKNDIQNQNNIVTCFLNKLKESGII